MVPVAYIVTGISFVCTFHTLSIFIVRFTYLLTQWSRVLLEKLNSDIAASQEIPRIYGTRKSLTVPTSARHLSLS
jgi:hypothetical protein